MTPYRKTIPIGTLSVPAGHPMNLNYFCWRAAGHSAEDLSEMALVCEPARKRDIRMRQCAVCSTGSFCAIRPMIQEPAVRGHPGGLRIIRELHKELLADCGGGRPGNLRRSLGRWDWQAFRSCERGKHRRSPLGR